MHSRRFVLGALLGGAIAAPARAQQRPPNTPEGWFDYVQRTGDRCGPRTAIAGSAREITRLVTTEALVNRTIRERVATATHIDLGTFRDDGNDCTAGALLKRRILASLGTPRGALPFAIGLNHLGSWHCVTLAITARGVYALDIQTPRERPPGAAADLLRFGPWYGEPEDGWTWSRLSAADLPRP